MILDVKSNITVDGRFCSLEKDILYFDDCVFRCVRLKEDNTLMYVRESNIHLHSFNKIKEFKNVQDMLGYILLITVVSIYLSSVLVELNKLIIN